MRVETLSEGFSVADDGVGIPDEEHDKVIEAGHSLTGETTGFGLGIVKEIVDAHGWEIRITGSDDSGIRVEITGIDIIA